MSISSIFAAPKVGQVGVETLLSVEATLSGQARWFLRAKPVGSSLALDAALAGAKFTPDAAGAYTVGVKDVTTTTPAPRFEGDPLATQPTDDEATAPETRLTYWVAETISRPVNAGRGAATLSLSTYDDQADETRPELVTLKAASGVAIGPDVLADPYLGAILSELKSAVGLSLFLGPSVDFLADLWRGLFHHTSAANLAGHLSADVSATPSGTPTTLSGCQAQLTALAADLAAHEANVTAHGSAQVAPVLAAAGTTLAQACAYAAAVDRSFTWHATLAAVHLGNFGDPREGKWREPPYDLATLCAFTDELSQRLGAHKLYHPTIIGAHNAYTTSPNLPNPFVQGMASPDAFAAIGQMVDALVAHVTSYAGTDLLLYPPVGAHTAQRSAPPISKPTDPAGAARAAEAVCVALEAHALDADAHLGRPALGQTRVRVGRTPESLRWPITVRLSARLGRLLGSATPEVPSNRNAAATLWRTFGGWT